MLACALARVLEPTYAVRFERSQKLDHPAPPTPTRGDLCAATLLLEQVDVRGFPRADALPPGCGIVRFPALDTNVLWPFAAVNPYDATVPDRFPSGRYPYGDRILARCIERGWDAERTIAYYCRNYDDFRIDLGRVAELERARRRARDAKADVPMADVLEDVVSEPVFWSNNHPRAALMDALLRRVGAVGARYVPELASLVHGESAFDDRTATWTAVPIHPGVAADLGLAWYDPAQRCRQEDGSYQTFDEYVREFVLWSIANRDRQRVHGTAEMVDPLGWRPPIEGPVTVLGPVLGIYPDGFAAPLLRFELEALDAVETFTVEAYYPPQQLRAATMVCSLGSSKVEAVIEPGTAFSLTLQPRLASRERARFSLACSQRLNMLERGESEDNRDLGALIVKMRAE